MKKFGSLHYPVITSVKLKPIKEFNIISSLMKMIKKLTPYNIQLLIALNLSLLKNLIL